MGDSMDAELKSNIKLVLFVFSFIVCLWLLKMLFPVITLVIIALLIVYLIIPLVEILKKMHLPQLAASAIVFFIFILTIILFSYFIPPMVFREVRQLAIYVATDFRQYVTLIFLQLNQIDIQFDLNLSQTLTSTIISMIERIPSYLLQGMNRISTLKIPF
jgi:predicted PurR-regulated permease PerM